MQRISISSIIRRIIGTTLNCTRLLHIGQVLRNREAHFSQYMLLHYQLLSTALRQILKQIGQEYLSWLLFSMRFMFSSRLLRFLWTSCGCAGTGMGGTLNSSGWSPGCYGIGVRLLTVGDKKLGGAGIFREPRDADAAALNLLMGRASPGTIHD